MDIATRLSAILKEYKGGDINVDLKTTFDQLGFDSLDKVELLMKIEEEFKITFEDDFQVETVGELVEKIKKLAK